MEAVGRRILILGAPGSGKSTLARALGDRLGLRVIHFDQLYWRSGWEPRTAEEMPAIVERAIAGDSWVFDGNNSRTLDLRASRADTLIWLDLPNWFCFARVLWRSGRARGTVRPDMAEGCPERFDPTFLRWAWRFSAHSRPAQAAFFENSRLPHRHRLTSPGQVRWLLAEAMPRSPLPLEADGLGDTRPDRP